MKTRAFVGLCLLAAALSMRRESADKLDSSELNETSTAEPTASSKEKTGAIMSDLGMPNLLSIPDTPCATCDGGDDDDDDSGKFQRFDQKPLAEEGANLPEQARSEEVGKDVGLLEQPSEAARATDSSVLIQTSWGNSAHRQTISAMRGMDAIFSDKQKAGLLLASMLVPIVFFAVGLIVWHSNLVRTQRIIRQKVKSAAAPETASGLPPTIYVAREKSGRRHFFGSVEAASAGKGFPTPVVVDYCVETGRLDHKGRAWEKHLVSENTSIDDEGCGRLLGGKNVLDGKVQDGDNKSKESDPWWNDTAENLIKKAREEEGLDEEDHVKLTFSQRALLLMKNPFFIIPAFFVFYFMFGMAVYVQVNDMDLTESLYFSVEMAFAIGSGVLHEKNDNSIYFSIFMLILGASFIAGVIAFAMQRLLERHADWTEKEQKRMTKKALHKDEDNITKMCGEMKRKCAECEEDDRFNEILIYILMLVFLVVGVMFGRVYYEFEWLTAIYFSLTMLSTAGLQGPDVRQSSSDANSGGVYDPLQYWFLVPWLAIGVPIFAIALSTFAEELLKGLTRAELRNEIKDALAENELKYIANLRRKKMKNRHAAKTDAGLSHEEFLHFTIVRMGLIDDETLRQVEERFTELDAEGSGLISVEVMHAMLLFERYDIDGSGEIELAEFASMLRGDNIGNHFGAIQGAEAPEERLSSKAIVELFKKIDSTKSNSITRREFVDFYMMERLYEHAQWYKDDVAEGIATPGIGPLKLNRSNEGKSAAPEGPPGPASPGRRIRRMIKSGGKYGRK